MSIDGSHDSSGGNSDSMQPSPGSDTPQNHHQITTVTVGSPGMSPFLHYTPWGALMGGGPCAGYGSAAAHDRTECPPSSSSPAPGPGRGPVSVVGGSGGGSPSDARFALDLRKTALLRSLLLRTEDAASGSGGPSVMPVDDQAPETVILPHGPVHSHAPQLATEGVMPSRSRSAMSLQVPQIVGEGEISENGGSMMLSPTGSLTDLSQPGWGLVRNASLGGLSRGACSMRSQSSLMETGA